MKASFLKSSKLRLEGVYTALFDDAITPVMLSVVGVIFAVELTANLVNGSGVIALLHLTIIGLLEIAILGLLSTALVRKLHCFLKQR